LYGPLIYRFAREARGHGVPEVMIAVATEDGRIRPQVSLVKAVASAVCIGAGGSVGPRGPDRADRIGAGVGSGPARPASPSRPTSAPAPAPGPTEVLSPEQ
jgi:chloride channel protein, CIC family